MDNTKNTIGAIFLGIIILVFIIGGFFAMKYLTNPKNIKKEDPKPVKSDEAVLLEEIRDLLKEKNKK